METKTTLSVALCTCNGEKYIEEQLLSILQQDLSVDEIVVSDDLSTDATLDIVSSIASTTSIPIRILTNNTSSHYGVCANFEKAINATTGDIIFFSDQDDVWKPYKTKIISDWFEKYTDKTMVFTDAVLVDEYGDPILRENNEPLTIVNNLQTSYDVLNKLCRSPYLLEAYLNRSFYTGATMAVRRSLVHQVPLLQLGEGKLHHDIIIALLAIDAGSVLLVPHPLIQYRIHAKQVTSLPVVKSVESIAPMESFLYPKGSCVMHIKFDKWPLNEDTKKRIHFYEYRYRLFINKIPIMLFLSFHRYYQTYGDFYMWRVDINYATKLFFCKMHNFLRKHMPIHLFNS